MINDFEIGDTIQRVSTFEKSSRKGKVVMGKKSIFGYIGFRLKPSTGVGFIYCMCKINGKPSITALDGNFNKFSKGKKILLIEKYYEYQGIYHF